MEEVFLVLHAASNLARRIPIGERLFLGALKKTKLKILFYVHEWIIFYSNRAPVCIIVEADSLSQVEFPVFFPLNCYLCSDRSTTSTGPVIHAQFFKPAHINISSAARLRLRGIYVLSRKILGQVVYTASVSLRRNEVDIRYLDYQINSITST